MRLRREPEVAGRELHHPVGQPEPLQHGLGVRHEQLQLVARRRRLHDPHQLDLAELVHPDQPAGVAAVRARLRPEARGVRGVGERQVVDGEGLAGVQVRQRHLGRRDEEQLAVRDAGLEQVGLELRQLPGAGHRLPVHQRRHRELGVAVLLGEVEEVAGQRALQLRALPAQHREPGARQLRRAREVEDPELLAEVDVVARGEVERRPVRPRCGSARRRLRCCRPARRRRAGSGCPAAGPAAARRARAPRPPRPRRRPSAPAPARPARAARRATPTAPRWPSAWTPRGPRRRGGSRRCARRAASRAR